MKYSYLFIGIAAALVVSCSVHEEEFNEPIQDDVEFYTSFEQPTEGTRVYVNEDLLLRWNADDRVSIFNKITYNQQYKFMGETGDNAGGFNRVNNDEYVTGEAIPYIVSVYPYQESTMASEEGVVTVMLPAEQIYAKNTFGQGANTMVSVSSDNLLQYKNVGGYLQLRLFGKGVSISSIILRGCRVEKLAGKASVFMSLNGIPSIQMSSEAVTEVKLKCNTPVALGATEAQSTEFWIVLPQMTFTDGFTISVYGENGGYFEKTTTKSVTIERNTLSKMSPIEVHLNEPSIPVPEIVDLGLSVKWASFNLGASKPEDAGDFYAWGEIEPKEQYDWSTYKWCKGTLIGFTKYCTLSSEGYNGFTDGKTKLDSEDDAAYMNLGGNWRMPTYSEASELVSKCHWSWTTINGVNGYKVSNNGNSIFLPAEGYMSSSSLYARGENAGFWTSELYSGTNQALYLWDSSSSGTNKKMYGPRYLGFFVRPVHPTPVEGISLDKKEIVLKVGQGESLFSTIAPADATNHKLIWSSSDPSVATVKGYYPIEGYNNQKGEVKALKTGVTTITVTTVDGGFTDSCRVIVNPSITVNILEPVEQVFTADHKDLHFDFWLDDGSTWERATVSYGSVVQQSFEENNSATFVKQIDAIQNGKKTYTITAYLKNGCTIEKNVYVTVSIRGQKDFFWGIYEEHDKDGKMTVSSCSASKLAFEYLGGVVSLNNIPSYPDMIEFTTTYNGTMWFMYPTEWDSNSISIIGEANIEYNTDFVRMVNDNTYLNGISYTVRYLPNRAIVVDFPWKIYIR